MSGCRKVFVPARAVRTSLVAQRVRNSVLRVASSPISFAQVRVVGVAAGLDAQYRHGVGCDPVPLGETGPGPWARRGTGRRAPVGPSGAGRTRGPRSARPSVLTARMSNRPLKTTAGRWSMESSSTRIPGVTRSFAAPRLRLRAAGVRGGEQPVEVSAFVVVQTQDAGDGGRRLRRRGPVAWPRSRRT